MLAGMGSGRARTPALLGVLAGAASVALIARGIGGGARTKSTPEATPRRVATAASGLAERGSPKQPTAIPVRERSPAAQALEASPPETEREAAQPPAARAPARPLTVALHEHGLRDPAFPGLSWILAQGRYEAGAAFADDALSSVEVPDGAVLILYDDLAGQGARVTLGPGRHDLDVYGFNDRASALWVAGAGASLPDAPALGAASVTLYEHRERETDLPGRLWTLELPEGRESKLFTAREGDFEDDAASAVWVPARHELVLCDRPDGRGPALVLGPGFHELELLDFNDRASAARVTRLEER